MASTSGVGSTGNNTPPLNTSSPTSPVNTEDAEAFEREMGSETPPTTPPVIDDRFRMPGWSGYAAPSDQTTPGQAPIDENTPGQAPIRENTSGQAPIDVDSYEPDTPDLPTPEEEPAKFFRRLASNIRDGVDTVSDFLGKPEFATFARVANIVFAGTMVVAAGVLFATGIGAPAALAALALAGGAGLFMQIPIVHNKLEAGVVALLTPIVGAENAEKLGPLATQALISGMMIAVFVTGGNAGSAQAALEAAVGVFNTMRDVFQGMALVYDAANLFLAPLGLELDSAALRDAALMFGLMGTLTPDLASFVENLEEPLKSFLENPDWAKFQTFVSALADIPEGLSVLDIPLLEGLGQTLTAADDLFQNFEANDIFQNAAGILTLIHLGKSIVT